MGISVVICGTLIHCLVWQVSCHCAGTICGDGDHTPNLPISVAKYFIIYIKVYFEFGRTFSHDPRVAHFHHEIEIQIALIQIQACTYAQVQFWRRRNAPINTSGQMHMAQYKNSESCNTQNIKCVIMAIHKKCLISCPHLHRKGTSQCCSVAGKCAMSYMQNAVILCKANTSTINRMACLIKDKHKMHTRWILVMPHHICHDQWWWSQLRKNTNLEYMEGPNIATMALLGASVNDELMSLWI